MSSNPEANEPAPVGAQPMTVETVQRAAPAQPEPVVIKDHGLWCDIKTGRTASVPYWLAIICLIINVLLSGIGTLISAIHPHARGMRCKIVIIGLLQLIFVWTFIAWIWSIVYGALILMHASDKAPVQPTYAQAQAQLQTLQQPAGQV